MKHLLIIALLLSGIRVNAQRHISFSGPADTVYYTDSNAFTKFEIDSSIGPIVCTYSVSATHNYKMVYRDTVVQDPSSEYYPGRMINSFNYSHSTIGHKVDTIFIYDHYQWLLQRVREEQVYWDAICKKNSTDHFVGLDAKIESLNVSIPAAKNRAYYSGMEDLLMDILYRRGETDWHFKSRDKSKRRTK